MDSSLGTAHHLAKMRARRAALHDLLHQTLPRPARIVWELGCGHGHFLTAYAQAHPDRLCVGIDLDAGRIERAARKRERANLGNLYFFRAEARLFLDELPPGVRFEDVYLLFPDPWPKLRHHKHRVVQPDFLSAVALRAEPAARLCFRTDHLPYFDDVIAAVRAHPDWVLADEPWPFEHETVFQSRAASFHSLVARRRDARP